MEDRYLKPNILRRICMAIPYLRRKLVEKEVKGQKKKNDTIDLCNRLISCMFAKNIVSLYNDGNYDLAALEAPDAYRFYVEKMLGKKTRSIMSQLRVERAKLKTADCKVVLVHLPSTYEVGQAAMVGFVITNNNEISGYSLEYSTNDLLMICSWSGEQHLNFGTAKDKVDFVKKIVNISQESETVKNSGSLDELDLKHRLAKEIGVRVEMLDFYMTKFQNKVIMEMHGYDTSGIDDDIENIEEWERYCNWEIAQAKKRMNPDELKISKSLFEDLISRAN